MLLLPRQFGTKMNSTKVMAYLFSFLNMLWHGMDHFDNTGEPMPVHGSTKEMLEFFDIIATEQNQFVFNQSAKYVTIICQTFQFTPQSCYTSIHSAS